VPASRIAAKCDPMVAPTAWLASPLILAGRFLEKLAIGMSRGEIELLLSVTSSLGDLS
jgi:hypothetical protein